MTTTIAGIFRNYGRLLTPRGREALSALARLATLAGLVKGAALLAMLALAVALAQGTALTLTPVAWLVVLATLAVAGGIIAYVQGLHSMDAAFDIMRNCHVELGDHIAELPMGWFTSSVTGRLSRAATQGMMDLGQGIAHMLDKFISNASALLVVMVGTLAWQPRLGLVLLVAVPVYFGAMLLGSAAETANRRRTEPPKVELADRVVEFARCQSAIRAAGRAHDFTPLTDAIEREERSSRRGLWAEASINFVYGMVCQVVVFTLILFAGRQALTGELGAIETITFIGLSLALMQVLTAMGEQVTGFQAQGPVLAVIEEVLNTPALPAPALPRSPHDPGAIGLERVSFAYDGATPVLRDISFEVPPHTMTALVGHSGSGKTTITKLIARFYDVTDGVVRVGGVDVRDQEPADLMGQLAIVFQDVYLFDDTLRANIAIGRPGATEREVDEAARLAGVTEIAERLPGGWDARVGEGGTALSGGERQRVSIARALLKDAPIVLFDEATSALDAENEANLVSAFDRLRERSTVIVIAHKLDTIIRADQIVVLNSDGSVNAIGRHEDLIDHDGIYRDFWTARHNAAGWSLVAAR